MKKNNSLGWSPIHSRIERSEVKAKKIAPHKYIICGGGYRTMRDILAFNKKIKDGYKKD